MTQEEKILARLDELTEALHETRRAARPFQDLKADMEPIIRQVLEEAIHKLGTHYTVSIEDVGHLVGQTLSSSANLAEGLKTLNGLIDLKKDLEPVSKLVFGEAILALDKATHGFNGQDLAHLTQMAILNMGNMAEMMKMLGSVMELKHISDDLAKQALESAIEKLEELKKKGVLDGMVKLGEMGQKMAAKAATLDLSQVKPVTGLFGMLGALKKPEVQKGLGVALELAGLLGALTEE